MKTSLLGALAILLTISFSIMPSTVAAQDCIPEDALPVPLPPDFPLGDICAGPDFPPFEEEFPPFEEELDGPPFEEELDGPPFEEELDGPPFEEEFVEELDVPPFEEDIAEEEVPPFVLPDDFVLPEDAVPSEEIVEIEIPSVDDLVDPDDGGDNQASDDESAEPNLPEPEGATLEQLGGNIEELKADDLSALDDDVITSLSSAQLAQLDKEAVGGFTAPQIAKIAPVALAGITKDQLSNLNPTAINGLTPDQFKNLNPSALAGFNSEGLGGLTDEVYSAMSEDDLANLDATEVREMDGADLLRLITNLNEFSVGTDAVAEVLPEGWEIDSRGELTVPPGTALAFPAAPPLDISTNNDLTVSSLPDFQESLSLGGDGSVSVLNGMDKALAVAGINDLSFSQGAGGILNIGTAGTPPVASFIPDINNMVQAPDNAVVGVSVDEKSGGYVIVTDKGYQIPLLPSISKITEVSELLAGSKIEVRAGGQISISNLTGEDGETPTTIAGITNPIVETSDKAAGTYRVGTGSDAVIQIVLKDGTAQTLKPAIKDQEAFKSAASAFGVEDLIFKVDGSVSLVLNGLKITLKPSFEIQEGAEGTSIEPNIIAEDGRYFVISSNGDKQEFVAAR